MITTNHAASSPTRDFRSASRLRTLKSGKIIFNAGRSVLDCEVRDISASGVRVRLGGLSALPATFVLSMAELKGTVPCRLVWQHGRNAGVRFAET